MELLKFLGKTHTLKECYMLDEDRLFGTDLLGNDFVRFAAMGYDPKWKMRQGWLSKRYTTRVKELLAVESLK